MVRAIIVALCATAAVQVALLSFLQDGATSRGTLRVGEAFPSLDLVVVSDPQAPEAGVADPDVPMETKVDRSQVSAVREACSLVVIASRYCGICLAMRDTWQREVDAWSASAGIRIESRWLFLDPPETLDAFMEHPEMDRTFIASIVGPGRRPGASVLGVIGTPTIFLVDRDGLLRVGVMGDLLPPSAEAARWCSV